MITIHSVEEKSLNAIQFIASDEMCDFVLHDIDNTFKGNYVTNRRGETWMLNTGNWIVYRGIRDFKIYTDAEFKRLFKVLT